MMPLAKASLLRLFGVIATLSVAGCTTSGKPVTAIPFANLEKSIDAGGYRVAYIRSGRGPTLVLLHGGGTWSYSWRRNIEELARNHDVIAIDFMGHGFTRRMNSKSPRYDLAQTNEFLEATLEALDVRQADFVGNSWGGGWALAFAQKHPDRVRRLILIGSSGLPGRDRLEWELLRWPLVGETLSLIVRRSDVEYGLLAAVADPRSVTDADISAIYAPLKHSEVQAAQVGFMRRLDFRLTAARLRHTAQPTLVLWGEKDTYATLLSQQMICRQMPNARLIVVARAGHVTHEDQPKLVNNLIIRFLASDDPKREFGDGCIGKPDGPR
jgi:pimeloyl-ACP methyl ester carboxylesterase